MRNEQLFPQRVLNWVYDGNYNYKTLESEIFESEEVCQSFRHYGLYKILTLVNSFYKVLEISDSSL